MEFLKQLGKLLLWIVGAVGLYLGMRWVDYSFGLTDSDSPNRDIWGNIFLGILLICAFTVWIAFARFLDNIRPLFCDAAVRGFGCAVSIAGVVIVFLPLIIAQLSTAPGGNPLDERSGGAAIWLMMFSVPAGSLVAYFGYRVYRANAGGQATKESKSGSSPKNEG